MQKVKYVLLSMTASVFVYAKVCSYPFEFKFATEYLSPTSVSLVTIKNKKYKELMFISTDDKYTVVTDTIPAGFVTKYNQKELIDKILSSERLDIRYLNEYKNEYKVDSFLLKHYAIKDQENILFVFDRHNKFLGTISIEVKADKLLKHIIGTLRANKNKCTKEEYLQEYKKLTKADVNKKLKLLFSLMLIERDKKELQKLAKEAKKVLEIKKTIYIDLPNTNLKSLIGNKQNSSNSKGVR